ncbi:helix-turn-helix domain-containing protein [Methylotuvimicrobium sp. KM1]|uniref:helix-turn-helix domain-containing protein n=1 Tax=Methylotuvimicrobium sp. KM1 TaxID=3377707 RepID=UPI003850483D
MLAKPLSSTPRLPPALPKFEVQKVYAAFYAAGVAPSKATDKLPLDMKATNMLPSIVKATYAFTKMNSLLHQIKQRRLTLGLKQNDMMLRVGVSRQQYQRLESKGNPRLDTLELIAKGLNSELMLIPKEKLGAVITLLEQESSELGKEHISQAKNTAKEEAKKSLSDDPWQDLLGDDS